ncbi:MAG: biopolymer transporter ExbD [Myxococcota bacterium]
MARPRRRMTADPPEINLVPLLDMVSLLIQLLLINAQFGVYAELSSALGQPVADDLPGLSLRVAIGPDGYQVSWQDGGSPQSRTFACELTPCQSPEAYDAVGLHALAAELKGANPDAASVELAPAETVPFEVMAATMDALRGSSDEAGALFPDIVLGAG